VAEVEELPLTAQKEATVSSASVDSTHTDEGEQEMEEEGGWRQ